LPKDKQREPIEIMMDMSEFLYSFGPQKVTKIERACNLRDDLCKQYLAELCDRQFIKKNLTDEYEILEKGVDFLRDTIDLYRKHFPERRKKIEEDRFWKPIRRMTAKRERDISKQRENYGIESSYIMRFNLVNGR
jgi:predicted transcriptional regulator